MIIIFQDFFSIFSSFSIKNIIDIILITLLMYSFFSLIENTKAEQLFKGVMAVLVLLKLSEVFGFLALNWLFKGLLNFGVIGFIVLFQPELRQVLEKMGESVSKINKVKKGAIVEAPIITEISNAVFNLSESKTGALIVLSRYTGLNDYIEKGTFIDAVISSAIIENIFIDSTPLHDGAIIIENNRIKAANCVLPLTERRLSNEFGTRHRASIGITENSDAIAIVVSEETGKISICEKGNIRRYSKKEFFIKDLTSSMDHSSMNLYKLGGKKRG